VATKILFSPVLPAPLMDLCREMMPPGYELIVAEHGKPEFYEACREVEYYLGFPRAGMGNEFFRSAPKMKLVQLISAGYDRLDVEAAAKAKVPVANNGGANSVAVAEHTIMLILAITKKLVWQHNNVVAGKWRVGDFAETRLYEVSGKRLGIVGLGNIGKKVARRLHGFDVDIVYYDILRLAEHEEDALGVRFVLLDELLQMADVVTLHVPLTPKTTHLIDQPALARMKRAAYLINTSRGPVVDEAALAWALKNRLIAGAALDVYEKEPEIHAGLMSLENVLLIPHLASATTETRTAMADLAVSNAIAVLNGQAPITPVP
jgi:glyoxylate reductase/D-3-phosphoglycerate dehydrogenase